MDETNDTAASISSPEVSETDLPAFTAMTVYMALLTITGLIGNVLVIVSVAITPRLRNTSYAYIVHLSIADLLVNVLVIPLMVMSFFNYGWPHSEQWCRFICYLFLLSVGISLLTLTVIAANRYCLVSCSRKSYQKYCGWKAVAIVLTYNWSSGILLVLVHNFTDLGRGIKYDPAIGFCYINESDVQTFWYVSAILGYGAVTCFMLIPFLYCKTFQTLKASKRRIAAAGHPNGRSHRVFHPVEIRLTKMMAVIFLVLMLCWTPLSAVHFFRLLADIPKCWPRLGVMLVLTNSSINPYLYAWINRNFWRTYKRILLCGEKQRVLPIHI